MKGLAPGAALVLLMAGPATNIATMAVIGNTLGKRSLWVYLGSIIGGALFFGIMVNELLPREWFTGAISSVAHVHEHTGWFKWTSSVVLVLLIVNGYVLKLLSARRELRTDREKAGKMTDIVQYRVEGMTCDHCKATVENGLKNLEGVSEVIADRENKQVSIQGEYVSESLIKETIEKLGYGFAGKF
jgi:copper chaperone CopZ